MKVLFESKREDQMIDSCKKLGDFGDTLKITKNLHYSLDFPGTGTATFGKKSYCLPNGKIGLFYYDKEVLVFPVTIAYASENNPLFQIKLEAFMLKSYNKASGYFSEENDLIIFQGYKNKEKELKIACSYAINCIQKFSKIKSVSDAEDLLVKIRNERKIYNK